MPSHKPTIHEVDFCAQVASAANAVIGRNPSAFPFHEARVEGFGEGPDQRKRKDLRFYDLNGKLVLCGEVKLPGAREGSSPYGEEICRDAEAKASSAGVRYFFTWNVNTFVLWDRSLWDRPPLERRVWPKTLGRFLVSPADVAREENLDFIKTRFLPDLLSDLADVLSGRRRDWLPPDDIFIQSLESHLQWPAQLAGAYILEQASSDKKFDLRVQGWMTEQDWTFVRKPQEEWAAFVDNMGRTLAYVWANRLLFYKALRARFPELPRLELRPTVRKPADAVAVLSAYFQQAVDRSGDYEPLLMPRARDWATELVFQPSGALDAWRGVLRGIESVDFREVPSDVVGRIFQKFIGPEERRRYGQHFTGDDVVDLINGFCIRGADDAVLDPACGSGSFLVRAYYRKRSIDPLRSHVDLLGGLFGCDIATYPAHLATLNLAAREINEEANYPRISRRNFFDTEPGAPFCHIPAAGSPGGQAPVPLPPLDAVVGNPPYVRQERVERAEKRRYAEIATAAWPDLHLSGRSDLHCYFWPAAARLLRPAGYFGFLTSSSWLDVEYGFALQGWLLQHFRILAIMESAAEPWFEDARVKTCATILQRCEDESPRMANRVRFVRFHRKLADILAVPPGPDEGRRQAAVEALRRRILDADEDCRDEDLRIVVKAQGDLWRDGIRAATVLRVAEPAEADEETKAGEEAATEASAPPPEAKGETLPGPAGPYAAGKWGRYVRAPDFYFEVMRRFAGQFVPLGEIATIRRGITSGCDAFFMPKDITAEALAEHASDKEFRRHAGGAPRAEVAAGKLRIIQARDGSVHAVEAKHLAPEVHSLMEVDRPIIRAADLDRVVLLVSEPMHRLRATAPWVWRYLRYGSEAIFASGKSKPTPVSKRSTCAARKPWYNLTGLVHPGMVFWPMAQQYRHIIAANPEGLICNHNLFDIAPAELCVREGKALIAILNSTLVGLFKTFYGRYAGTEGNLKTEVVDVNLLEVPDPRGIRAGVAKRLAAALGRMQKREVGRLVEEPLMDCHSPQRARMLAAGPLVLAGELEQPDRRELDDTVFGLLGVADPQERALLVGKLHEATARHFRDIRVVEIEKMQQRAKAHNPGLSADDLAADIWDAAELQDATPLADWLARRPECDSVVILPEDRPAALADNPLFAPATVYFGKDRTSRIDCASTAQADLVTRLANLGMSGDVKLPAKLHACAKLLVALEDRLERANIRFRQLVGSRTGDERARRQLMEVLERWFVLGREVRRAETPADDVTPEEEALELPDAEA